MGRAPAALLACLLAACGGEAPPGSPPPPGTAVRVEGLDVPEAYVAELYPYIQGYRPGEAAAAVRRHILMDHAIPLAWALARRPEAFARAREEALSWRERVARGETTLAELEWALYPAGSRPASPPDPITVARSTLPLAVAAAAFQAEPGALLGPILSPQGWHLVQVVAHHPRLIRDQDLVTLRQVVSLAGGPDHIEELRRFKRRLAGSRGLIEAIDPGYAEVIPVLLRKRAVPPGGR